jgi:hypothetical protein
VLVQLRAKLSAGGCGGRRIAERLEWWVLWWLAKDEHGLLTKERIRAAYDGTLWELIAAEREGRTPFVYPEGSPYRPAGKAKTN